MKKTPKEVVSIKTSFLHKQYTLHWLWLPAFLLITYVLVMTICIVQEGRLEISRYYGEMQASAYRNAHSFSTTTEIPFTTLETLADQPLFSDLDSSETTPLRAQLDAIAETSLLDKVLFLRTDGQLLDPTEGWLNAEQFPDDTVAITEQRTVIKFTTPYADENYVLLLTVPVRQQNQLQGCLIGLVSIDAFQEAFDSMMPNYRRLASYYIVDDTGTILMESSQNAIFHKNDNLTALQQNQNLQLTESMSDIFDLQQLSDTKIQFTFEDKLYFAYSHPLHLEDTRTDNWFLLEVTAREMLLQNLMDSMQKYVMISLIFFCTIVIVSCFMLSYRQQEKQLLIESQRAQEGEQQLKTVLQFSGINIIDFDFKNKSLHTRLSSVNQPELSIITRTIPDLVEASKLLAPEAIESFQAFYRSLRVREVNSWTGRCRYSTKDAFRYYQINCRTFFDANNKPLRATGVVIDVQDQMEKIEAIRQKAETDALTGLFNRESFQQFFEMEYQIAQQSGFSLALLFLDIDDFKNINDSYGHQAGDRALCAVGHCLKQLLREQDCIARFGGDEFAICMTALHSEDAVCSKAVELCSAIAALEQELGGIPINCSIGIALYPQHANNFQELYKLADQALYEAKRRGKNTWVLYEKHE